MFRLCMLLYRNEAYCSHLRNEVSAEHYSSPAAADYGRADESTRKESAAIATRNKSTVDDVRASTIA